MHCVTSRSSEASEPLRHEMWLTVGWRLEGILFERIWKLMSAGWMWGKSQLSLCFLSVSRASADEFTDMRVSLSGFSPSRVMIEIKNDFCWPLAAAWRGGKDRRRFQGYLGCHSWHFEGTAFSSQTTGNDIYAQFSTDMWAVICALHAFSSLNFLLLVFLSLSFLCF